jgi:hypothetical protein
MNRENLHFHDQTIYEQKTGIEQHGGNSHAETRYTPDSRFWPSKRPPAPEILSHPVDCRGICDIQLRMHNRLNTRCTPI